MTSRNPKSTMFAATTLALGLGLAGAANAQTSSPAEIRGYQTCLQAAERQSKQIDTARHYLLQKNAGDKQYFINGYQWQNGDRVAVRVACSTSSSGRKLHEVAVNEGRFSNQNTRVTVEVAQK